MKKLKFLAQLMPLLCFLMLVLSSCSSLRSGGIEGQNVYTIEGKVSVGFDASEYSFFGFEPTVLLNGHSRRVIGVVYHARTYAMAVQMRNRLMGMGMFEEVKIMPALNE
jgi:hypothetical protein